MVLAPARFGAMGRCVQQMLSTLALPRPTRPWVDLVFPFAFSPGDEASPED